MRTIGRTTVAGALALLLAAGTAHATDGHFLHGVGAVNSAMGGAGVAAPRSLLGAYYLNPAGLLAFDGTRMEFGFELFKPDRTLSSDIPGMGAGATVSKSDWVPVPAMALSTRLANDRVVVGVGALGIGGFGVDYPASTTNPLLTPQPNGFGQVYSSYQFLKIAPAVAVEPLSGVWVGAALNVDWASLAVRPMPVAPPAVGPGPAAFYPDASAGDGAFGAGFQVGLMVKPNDLVAFGASYTSPQWFEDFMFYSTEDNPNLPTHGMPHEIRFGLDVPAVIAAGIGFTPLPNVTLALDGRYLDYANTDGFRESGFNPDGSMKGFGWQSIFTLAAGTEVRLAETLALRAGYNWSENPIRPGEAFYNVPAPAIVQHHLTVGAGVQITRRLELSAAYYRAFQNELSGPIPNPALPAGASVTSSLAEHALLVQFTLTGR